MAVVAETDSKSDDKYQNNRKAYRTVLDKAEAEEEYEIEQSEDNGKPGIFIHHGKAQEIEYPAFPGKLDARDQHEDTVDYNVHIKGKDDRLNDPVPYKALEVIFLSVKALDKSVA